MSSRITGRWAVVKFAAATGATPIADGSIPGTFTIQIQAAFQEPCLLVVTDPRADHQPLTEAYLYSPLHCVDIAIHATRELIQCLIYGGCWPGKFCACVAPSPVNTHGRRCLISTSAKTLKRKGSQLLRKMVKGLLQFLNLLLLNLRLQSGLKACRCLLCPFCSSPLRTVTQPTMENSSAAATAQATESVETTTECLKLFFYRLLSKMEI
ncbi:40S ribosomal protein SA, partial [Plecturocebus cupreus]